MNSQMNRWILLLAALAAWASTAQGDDKIVCYFSSWAVYRPDYGKFDVEDIPPFLCTHMIFSFIGISETGEVRVLDSWNELETNYGKGALKRFTNHCKKHNIKSLVAMGGWNEGSTKYSAVAANESLRKKFALNVKNFIEQYGFDGFDLDWEYPCQRGGKPEDKKHFTLLLQELRKTLGKALLSIAVAAAEPSASQSYEIAEMSRYLDFINIMAYDLHGSWESKTGHNAPLYARPGETGNDLKLNVDACVNYWIKQGCPPEKLILGVPFYGRSFTLANSNQNGLGAPTTGPGAAGPYTRERGFIGYNEICVNLKQGGWTVVRDQEQKIPYAYKGNEWVGYDDVISLTKKVEYINQKGLGGAMMWSIETDDFRGSCGQKFPLLTTLNGVRGGVPPVVDPVPTEGPSQTEPSVTQTQPPATQPPATQPPPPPNGICKTEGWVVDKNDCNIFYRCHTVNGQYEAVRQNCAPGLGFNTKINGCDYKENVKECH